MVHLSVHQSPAVSRYLARRPAGLTLLMLAVLLMVSTGLPRTIPTAQAALPPGLTTADWAAVRAQIPLVVTQQAYLKASNTGAFDQFGYSLALSDNTLVVGAPFELSAATSVNGDQTDNSATDAGAAYVFVRTGTTWTQQAYLKASNTGAGDRFGWSVAVAGDTVVVGATLEDSAATGVNGNQVDNSATDAGAAYVFVRTGTTWMQQAYLKASNTGADDYFGWTVAVAGDTVVIGTPYEDSAATGMNGNQADNSATDAGAAYVFVRTGTTWMQQTYLKASNTDAGDSFGWSVAVAGDTVVIGAPFEASAATGVNGDQANNSDSGAGAAYMFVRSGTIWTQQAYLKASNTSAGDLFGWSVAVAGDTVVIGAPFEDSAATGVNGDQTDNSAGEAGAAYVFVRAGATWTQQTYLKASNSETNDRFGQSVAIDGDTVIVGAPYERSAATGVNGDQTDNSAGEAGAAYVFVRSGTTWTQQAYLKASNTGVNDLFGASVMVAGDTVAVGASFESSAATGVNGDQTDNSAIYAGAAYTFVGTGPVPSATATTTPTATANATATAVPSATTTAVPSATTTAVPSATSTAMPSATSTAVPSATSTAVPSATTTAVPSATTTAVPSTTTTAMPSATSTAVPSATTTAVPSATTTAVPSATTTAVPSTTTTAMPSATTTAVPSATTTAVPSATTTAVPSATTTAVPSATTTAVPSATTTAVPSTTTTAMPSTTTTAIPTTTVTALPTSTRTVTTLPTSTRTATMQPSVTTTAVPTSTRTVTALPTSTQTAVPSTTTTVVPSTTTTAVPSATTTIMPTRTITALPTSTRTVTALPTSTRTATIQPSMTTTAVPTSTRTVTAVPTSTQTAVPTTTQTSMATATATPSDRHVIFLPMVVFGNDPLVTLIPIVINSGQ